MKAEVRFLSRGGNTQKLAEAVADAVGAQALPVSQPLTEKVDVLFLGSSVYAGKPDKQIIDFIKDNAANIGCIAVFSSSASGRTSLAAIRAAAADAGVKTYENCFGCYGAFMFLHKGHPDKEDLQRAAQFAKAVLEQIA